MRAPTPSFRDQLSHVRRQVASEEQTEKRVFELAVIDRWSEHAAANEAWEAIDRAATSDGSPYLEPVDLIAWVLEKGWEHHRLVTEIVPQSKALEDRAVSQAEKNWRTARNGDPNFGILAGIQNKLARNQAAMRLRVLGRQPNPRKLFILACRELFIANCGQPLDQVTEILLFAVSGAEPKTNEVRDALKASTRAGRHSAKT
ncbi:hypothetical protein QCM77_12685 [Bradyrhizobium sp. SSUT18]|uniref:hypothetical protein n=1 Tax=Bradyrhizobium sp. SSUT18 TaxID=3040602 RepID=UPI00244A2A0F|nr:hypothetical protein [Bradyrhizobium sp. SSUT18]MDH2400792.1 hypothetical protein [Bradyrhizobium sp. SSUT18]